MSDKAQSRRAAIPLALYSVLFCFALGYGYYLLVPGARIAGFLLGGLLAALAWNLGRLIGLSESGIKGHTPLFILLLMISAAGVFNTLFLQLEGRTIFGQRIDVLTAQLQQARQNATAPVDALPPDIQAWRSRVDSASTRLLAEIRNAQNCGQGPQARELIAELQRAPLTFTPLSVTLAGCNGSDRLAAEYEQRVIPKAKQVSPEYRRWNIQEREEAQASVLLITAASLQQLSTLRQATNDATPVKLLEDIKPQLQRQAEAYDEAAGMILRYAPDRSLQPTADLRDVESLGEWSQLVNLVILKINKPTTWLYGALAVGADWMLESYRESERPDLLNQATAACS
jgi:hypothetical protein